MNDFGLQLEVAQYLAHAYGDRAVEVLRQSPLTGNKWPVFGRLLTKTSPYIDGEIEYACNEYAVHAHDVITRRLPLALTDVHTARDMVSTVVMVMTRVNGWTKARADEEISMAHSVIDTYDIEARGFADPVRQRAPPMKWSAKEVCTDMMMIHD